MRNLYVIAIGGSGERILRSFVMLMSAGVSVGAERVTPIIIDNDENADALTKCKELIEFYRSNRDGKIGAHVLNIRLSGDTKEWGSFFKTTIEEPILLTDAGSEIGNLARVIGGNATNPRMDNVNEEMGLLFTQNDLDMPLHVGFIGNPNIGSIVLHSHALQKTDFTNAIGNCSHEDGVIVLGSLFGGTGAAGIPLIANKVHSITQANRPVMGAVALLPYFKFEGEDRAGVVDAHRWDVDAESFEAKTRAALMYYDEYMHDQVEYQYYIGDDAKVTYEHNNGGEKQANPAHLVELMAAMSIVDFSKQGHRDAVTYKRPIWGIHINTEGSSNTNISGVYDPEIQKALIKFQLMEVLFKNDNFLKNAIRESVLFITELGITNDVIDSVAKAGSDNKHAYAWGMNHIIQKWDEWLAELCNDKQMRPLLLYKGIEDATNDNLGELFYAEGQYGIARTKVKKPLWGKEKIVILDAEMDEALRTAYDNFKGSSKKITIRPENQLGALLKIISDALDDVIEKKFLTYNPVK